MRQGGSGGEARLAPTPREQIVTAVVGATAVGKSEAALDIAERLGAEIVSIDSMQIYRGMDIGTDKPSPSARERVRHHLLDLRPTSREITVAEFQAEARAAIADISGRGSVPLLVGGSGLYFRAVVDDLRFPPRSHEVRRALEHEASLPGGPGRLYERLEHLDPGAARRIEASNTRRVVRALEIVEVTGDRGGDFSPWRSFASIYDLRVGGLRRARDDLYRRIASRAERMLEAGLVEEVRRLEREGLGPTARQALGYRQVLESPGASAEELRAAIVRATKRFARRQESWFRSDPRVVWFDAGDPGIADRLVRFLQHPEEPARVEAGNLEG
jgi:tRNA dimethylallyltransferase